MVEVIEAGVPTRFQRGHPPTPRAGRPSKREIMRELVEAEFDEWMAVYRAARDAGDQRLALDAAERILIACGVRLRS